MLNPDEIIDMQLETSAELLEQFRATRGTWDYAQASTSLGMAFDGQLTAALVRWRHDLGDPRPILRDALQTAREARTRLASFRGKDRWMDVDFAAATLLSFLVEGSFGEELRAELPARREWPKARP